MRQFPGCVSPSAAILVDVRGERLFGAYNDSRRDVDASWLPLERVADCHAVLGEVRWPEGAAAMFDAAARYGIVRVCNGDVGSRERRIPAPTVFAIDTLAAGDVWHGAFRLGLTQNMNIVGAGRLANAAAATKCSRAGGRLGAARRSERTLDSLALNSVQN